jgi:NADH-quinone oxidoreductase subunit J
MVLFLFVIMLVNVGAEERGTAVIFNKPPQVAAALVFSLLLVMGLLFAINRGYQGLQKRDAAKLEQAAETRQAHQQNLPVGATGVNQLSVDTERVGTNLYTYAALPFEIASVLLLVAIIGSVMLARTLKQEVAADDVDPEVLSRAKSSEPEATS